MTTKRPPPLDDPPSASSDEEDEIETEDEQEEEIKTTTQQSQSEESEEEEEEEEEESESESEQETQTPKSSSIFEFESDIKSPSVSNFAIKPSKKISSFSTPEKKQIIKRPPSVDSDLKNKKKVKVSNESSSVIKRVWSEDDELMLLQGFIDYQSKNGCSPLSDMDGFYRFTMDFLPGNASKSQLYEKVRRLKKKFRVNEEKASVTGEDVVFVKPHERKLFEVSKRIWGVDGCETVGNVGGSSVRSKARSVQPKAKAKVKDEKAEDVVDDEDEMLVEGKGFETLYPYWNAGLNLEGSSCFSFPKGIVGLFGEELSLIEEAKAEEMNEKWKLLFEKEAVLQKRKIALLSEVGAQ